MTTSAVPAVMPEQFTESREYREVPLEHLRLSPLNPRKHFDPARLHELAEIGRASCRERV